MQLKEVFTVIFIATGPSVTFCTDCDSIPLHTIRRGRMCYILNETMIIWPAAKAQCENMGWRFAKFDTEELLAMSDPFIRRAAPYNADWYLTNIGFQQIPVPPTTDEPWGNWFWTDGTEVNTSTSLWQTAGNQPSDSTNYENCGDLAAGVTPPELPALLNDIPCNSHPSSFICEADIEPHEVSENEIAIMDNDRLNCVTLAGKQVGSSCFFIDTTGPQTWDGCFAQLQQKGARPARIYTKEIMDIVSNMLVLNTPYWTALKPSSVTATHWMSDTSTPDQMSGDWEMRPKSDPSLASGGTTCLKLTKITGNVVFQTEPCATASLRCLGEIVGPFQKYNHLSTNQLLQAASAASVLNTITVDDYDTRLCAFECQQTEGCLGYNFFSNRTCELLAFKTDGVPSHGTWVYENGAAYHERVY